jgi:hypothetical protein
MDFGKRGKFFSASRKQPVRRVIQAHLGIPDQFQRQPVLPAFPEMSSRGPPSSFHKLRRLFPANLFSLVIQF